MREQEYQRREMWRYISIAAFAVTISALQAVAGQWWMAAIAFLGTACFMAAAVISWLQARDAHPDDEVTPPKKPTSFALWFPIVWAAVAVLIAASSLAKGNFIDAICCLLLSVMMLVGSRDSGALVRRLLTRAPKAPVRPGPPQEWL